MKNKIREFETNSKNKNVRDLCRGISEFKKGYQPRTSIVKNEMGVWLHTPSIVWIGGGIISLNY